MQKRMIACCSLFSIIWIAGLQAQVGEEDSIVVDYELRPIVVTASKLPESPGNVTQKIDLIGRRTLQKLVLGNRNIAEAIENQSGASVSVLSRNDANWGSYGGVGPKYSTYMLGGLPIDAFVDPMSLDLLAVQSIEVQRGPASVLYPNYLSQDFAGNQCPLSGTINLILKEKIRSSQTILSAGYGTYQTINSQAYHQNRMGSFHYFYGGQYEQSDYTNYGTKNSWLNMIDNPEYKKYKFFGGSTLYLDRLEKHKLSFFYHQTNHSGDVGRPNRDYDHQYRTAQMGYSAVINPNLTAQIKIGFRNYDRTWEDDHYSSGEDLSLASNNGVKQSVIPGDVTVSIQNGEHNRITFGTDFQLADYQTFEHPVGAMKMIGNESRSTQMGIYAQEEMTLKSVILRTGVRYNVIKHEIDLLGGLQPGEREKTWNKFLWSCGIRIKAPCGFAPFANVGTSFMTPSLKSMGGTLKPDDEGAEGKHGQLPNSNLKPEEGLGLDLGLEYTISNKWFFTLRGFYNAIQDAIVENVVSEDPSQSQSVNAGESTAQGIEAEIRHRVDRRMEWFANFTYTHTVIHNDVDDDQDGAFIPFVPKQAGNVGLSLELPQDVEIRAALRLTSGIYDSSSKSGRRHFDGYEILNIKIQKSFAKRIQLYIQLYNVTNNRFEMPWQFRDPGFSASGGIQVAFQ